MPVQLTTNQRDYMSQARITRRAALAAMSCIAAASLFDASAGFAQGADPSGKVNNFYAALMDCMKQAKQLGLKGRYDKLAIVVPKSFDVPAMAKTAVGAAWDSLSPPQQGAIVEAMQRMMVATYANRFDDFNGEKFEVAPPVDQGADKLVKTRLIQSNGKVVNLNYLMKSGGDGFRINDIYLDGTISELAGRRAEFSTIMKSGGPDALITSLKAKGDKLLAGS